VPEKRRLRFVSIDLLAIPELTRLLGERADDVVTKWTEAVSPELRGRLSQAEVRSELQMLHELLVASLQPGPNGDATAEGQLRAALGELSRSRAVQGFSPTETARTVFGLKTAITAVIADDDTAIREFPALSAYIDDLGLYTFEVFTQARDRVITQQAEQLLELSTPVVKLWEGVVAVPLVGTLDSARTQVVMEKLLQALIDTGSEHAIIDITGVPAVDTQVAQHLLKTIVAARLMGAECIISGIRPQIAQTIVSLGIEFGDIATKSSLADALSLALRKSGVVTVRNADRAR
jgi:rsbT co-antagonist protein RsbR